MWLDAAPSFTRVKLDGAARDMSNAAARVLFSGDVCGKLDALCKRVAFVNKRNGPFDALVCVGQFLPSDADGVDGMQVYLQGKKTFPLPTYFIGDYGECSGILLSGARAEAAKVGLTSNGIRVCDNLFWLKGSGILTLKGLRIAFLGGKHDATVYRDPKAAAAAGAHHEDDVDALRALADDPGVVDVFLSNEWPSGILKFADSSVVPEALSQPASGVSTIAELAAELKPRYHIAGCEEVFYAREPYRSPGASHVTRFIGLGSVGNDKKQKFIHALSLTPASRMTAGELGAIVANTTPSPYDFKGESADYEGLQSLKKRTAENLSSQEEGPEGQYWRYAENKRQKMGNGSAGERVCFEFVSKGSCSRGPKCHFMHDINGTPIPRGSCFEFITKGSCEKGADCRYRHSLEPGSDAKRPTEPCWFCLSNATVDAHLVISVGDHCYCAMAKGPLVPGHVLVLPIEHYPSVASLPPETLVEIEVYKEALRNCYKNQDRDVVMFERYLQLRAGTHAHLQIVPVPVVKADKVEEAFQEAGKRVGFKFQVFSPADGGEMEALKTVIGGDVNYFSVELPDGRVLAHPLSAGEKIPMQFGREVLADLLEMPERGDWKVCRIGKDEETAMVEDFKDKFQKFDPDED